MQELNGRPHRATRRAPVEMLAQERGHLHALPAGPYAAALGETRTIREDQTVRLGDVPYSTPPGHVGQEVWVRVEGEEVVVVGRGSNGYLVEVVRHELSTPGRPRPHREHRWCLNPTRGSPGREGGEATDLSLVTGENSCPSVGNSGGRRWGGYLAAGGEILLSIDTAIVFRDSLPH